MTQTSDCSISANNKHRRTTTTKPRSILKLLLVLWFPQSVGLGKGRPDDGNTFNTQATEDLIDSNFHVNTSLVGPKYDSVYTCIE